MVTTCTLPVWRGRAAAQARCREEAPSAWHLAQWLAEHHGDVFDATFGPHAAERVLARPAPSLVIPDIDLTLDGLADGSPTDLCAHLDILIGPVIRHCPAQPATPVGRFPNAAPVNRYERQWLRPLEHAMPLDSQAAYIREAVARLRMSPVGGVMVVAPGGSGRTTFLKCLAGVAPMTLPPVGGLARVLVGIAVDDLLNGDPGHNLRAGIEELEPHEILVLDDAEQLLDLPGDGQNPFLQMQLLRLIRSAKVPAVLCVDERRATSLQRSCDMIGHSHRIVLGTPSIEELERIVSAAVPKICARHTVVIPPETVSRALITPGDADDTSQPKLAIERLELGAARAATSGRRTVELSDLGLPTQQQDKLKTGAEITARLTGEVLGQPGAVTRVTRHILLAQAGLSVRPERPHAALLFVGPTGVGKTAMAHALSTVLYGSDESVIRLDMSEYSDQWAAARLTGPQPGYVGYDQPEAWLTTKVRNQPRSVILLDEIEKAHPTVWNVFLQVFDAGRLTDSRGNVALFNEAMIVMTSNLGVSDLGRGPVGFADDTATASQEILLAAVEKTMPPELVNRLDEVVVFEELTEGVIFDIARKEINRIIDRLSSRGYQLVVPHDVVEAVAKAGYDHRFGARHVHRAIERLLLAPLAECTERKLLAHLSDGTPTWRGHPAS